MGESVEPLASPVDRVLAEWAATLNDAGHWAWIYDAGWRLVFATDDIRVGFGDTGANTFLPFGFHRFSAESNGFNAFVNRGRMVQPEFRRAWFLELAPYVLATMPGGRDELRRVVDPEFADLVDELQPIDVPDAWPGPTPVSSTVAGVEVAASVRGFGLTTLMGILPGFASCSYQRRGCRSLRRRPRRRTWSISNGCRSSSVPIGVPPRF